MNQLDAGRPEWLSSDRPLADPNRDWLGVTEHFIPRLARVSVEWPSEDGLVVGLYGPWGIGKSTILSLLRFYVEQRRASGDNKYAQTYVVGFNPWFYDDHAALITSFFATVASEVGAAKSDTWEAASKGLRTMGKFLSVASQGVSLFGVGVDLTKVATAASNVLEEGGALAGLLSEGEVKLRHARKDVEIALHEVGASGGRILVLLDEVDRLELPELLNLLRLVRFVADLPFVTIVAAMDEHRVRTMLRTSEHVGGEEFLDKFVQVPVQVPLPSKPQLASRIAEELELIAKHLGIPVTEGMFTDPRRTGASVVDMLLGPIITPRHLARFLNSLRVLLLAGDDLDVNIMDAALVEALHVFYPQVYERIRGNKQLLTRVESPGDLMMRLLGNEDQQAERRSKLYHWILYGTSLPASPHDEALPRIIEHLFGDFREPGPLPELLASIAAAERRVRSPDCFDRYFVFQSPAHELKRRDVTELLQELSDLATSGPPTQIADLLSDRLLRSGDSMAGQLVQELRVRFAELPPATLEQIGLGIVEMWERVTGSIAHRLLDGLLQRLSGSQDYFGQSAEVEERYEHIIRAAVLTLPLGACQELLSNLRLDRILGSERRLNIAELWVSRVEDAVGSFTTEEGASAYWKLIESAMAHSFFVAAVGGTLSIPHLRSVGQNILRADPAKRAEIAEWAHHYIGPSETDMWPSGIDPRDLIQRVFGSVEWLEESLADVYAGGLPANTQMKNSALVQWLKRE